MIKVSVLIPIYNVQKYLTECLESVINQTLEEIEILCIDDGSTDDSGIICDDYAKRDARIRVMHKQNTGYGHSLNVGISEAKGEYIAILEPDDYIDKRMYGDLYNIAAEQDLDIIKSNFHSFYGDGNERIFKENCLYSQQDIYNRVFKPIDVPECFLGTAANWTGLYRTAFLREKSIKHNETAGASYQDQGFYFLTFMFANRVYIYDDMYYNYRQDNPNASMLNKSKAYCVVDECHYIYDRIKNISYDKEDVMIIFFKFKYYRYWYNLRRISPEYVYEFGETVCKEYRLDDADMSITEHMYPRPFWIHVKLYAKIRGVYDLLTEKEDKINTIFDNLQNVKIYGEETSAEKLLTVLNEENRKKVKGYVLPDLKDYDNETLIITTAMHTWNNTAECLENAGITDYLILEPFIS